MQGIVNKLSLENYIEYRTGVKVNIKSTRKLKHSPSTSIDFETYSKKLHFCHLVYKHNIFQLQEPTFPDNLLHRDLEAFHLKVLKCMLSVKKTCSDINARFETGSFPVSLSYIPKAIKFWSGLHTNINNTLLKETYLCARITETNWAQGIQYALTNTGYGYLWNSNGIKLSKQLTPNIKEMLKAKYAKLLMANDSTKFKFLNKIIIFGYKYQNYLTKIYNPRHRTTITKLRTNTHCLATETQYYSDTDNSICKYCKLNTIETPEHFLLQCTNTTLESLRQPIVHLLKREIPNLELKNVFEILLTCSVPDHIIKELYYYIHCMYERREGKELPI